MGPNTGAGAAVVDNSAFGGPNATQAAAANAALKITPTVPTYQNTVNGVTPTDNTGFNVQNPAASKTSVEPTVISSSNITNNVIPALHAQAAAVSQKGTYVDQTGAMRYSDGSLVPAPTSAEYDASTGMWKDATGNYSAGPQFVDNPTNDPDVAQANSLFDSLKANLDANTMSQVTAIQQQYDALRSAQTSANNAADSVRTTLNLRSGTTRFAPLDAAGTALAQTTYGLQQIAKLDADENSAIATVKQAQATGNYNLMSKALDMVDQSRQAKQAAAQKISDQLSAANDALQKQQQQSLEDNAIATLVGKGVTNPAEVLKQMNAAGYKVTSADIATALKNLVPTSSTTDTYKFDATKTGSLLGAGLTMKQIQDVQDYYNGKGNAAALAGLTDSQKAAVQTALVGKTPAAKTPSTKTQTSGTLSYTAGDLATGNAKLQAAKGSDNYTDPNLYLNMATAWTGAGGAIKDFLKAYPMSSWVNPANTFVTPAINDLIRQDAAGTKTTTTKGTTDLATEINNLFTSPQ